jgi:uncharacterized membrane protein
VSPTGAASSSTGLDARLASVLCYSLWWVTGGLFLLIERQDPAVRFHAAQSLVLFGAISVMLALLGAFSAVTLVLSSALYQVARAGGDLLWVGSVVLWLVVVLRTWRGDLWRVPLAAELADRVAKRTSS